MRTLNLPLKAKWYRLIESGVKKEEYREIKDYWTKRICKFANPFPNISCGKECNFRTELCDSIVPNNIEYVCFSYGYTKRRMKYEVKSISVGKGNPQWGAPTDKEVFIFKLGNRVQ